MLFHLTHVRHPLPKPLSLAFNVDIDFPSRIGLCTIDIPDFAHLPIAKRRGKSWKFEWVAVSAAEKKTLRGNSPLLLVSQGSVPGRML